MTTTSTEFLTAKSLKVTCVLSPDEVAALADPATDRVVLRIRVGAQTVSAEVAAKAIRKAQAAIREHTAAGCAVIVQGKLQGTEVTEAGVVVQPKVAKQAAA